MVDLTNVLMASVTLIGAIITTFIIPVLRKNLSAQEIAEMVKWAKIGVAAAQQLYHELDGAARKQYVQEFMKSKGYDVNDKAVDAAIESEVLKLHQQLNPRKE